MAVTREEAIRAIQDVEHPAINCSLLKLGIAKEIEVENNKITLTIALPFAGIPEQMQYKLANSLVEPLSKLGSEIAVQGVVMTETEKRNFLALEKANWKGGENPCSCSG